MYGQASKMPATLPACCIREQTDTQVVKPRMQSPAPQTHIGSGAAPSRPRPAPQQPQGQRPAAARAAALPWCCLGDSSLASKPGLRSALQRTEEAHCLSLPAQRCEKENHAKYKLCAEGRAAAVLIHLTRSMHTLCKPLLVDCPSIGSELLTSTQAWEAPPTQLTARALAASGLASVRSEGFSRCSTSNPGLRSRLPDTAAGRAPSSAPSLTGGQPTTADGQSSQTAARRAGSDETQSAHLCSEPAGRRLARAAIWTAVQTTASACASRGQQRRINGRLRELPTSAGAAEAGEEWAENRKRRLRQATDQMALL